VDVAALRVQVAAEIDGAAADALASPMPDPATACEGVFCVEEPEPLGDGMAPWSGFEHDRDA
jgi:pyruvate dehydrogenase E1 component alpha subunit